MKRVKVTIEAEATMDAGLNSTGTSLQGRIEADYEDIVAVFGKPSIEGSPDNKVDIEWKGIIWPIGAMFTIYNYKDGPAYLGDEGTPIEKIRDWHIGAKRRGAADLVERYFYAAACAAALFSSEGSTQERITNTTKTKGVEIMTAQQTTRKQAQEHVHELHEKYYGRKKAKQAQKAANITSQAVEKVNRKLAKAGVPVQFATKKLAEVASQGTKTTGVGISSHPKQAQEGNGKVTRKSLMLQAQAAGVKYFRILSRSELEQILNKKGEVGATPETVAQIQERAKVRWKAGWTNKAGSKKEAEKK